jgi:hypothetical protein
MIIAALRSEKTKIASRIFGSRMDSHWKDLEWTIGTSGGVGFGFGLRPASSGRKAVKQSRQFSPIAAALFERIRDSALSASNDRKATIAVH